MPIPFVKASACGNDFLIIDSATAPPDSAAFTRRICNRQNGVGANGVEWLYPATGAAVEARLINADGSAAEISGNGTRCVAAYLCSERRGESFLIRTGAGDKLCNLTSQSGYRYEFETGMGAPQVGPERSLATGAGEISGIPVSMGNPHFVVFVEAFPQDWTKQSREIQSQTIFLYGVNVEFVCVRDAHHIEVRFYERGVGETLSSGTGSSAAAAAAIATRRAQATVRVDGSGGSQFVRWKGNRDDELYLRGSADLICRGEFFE
jgi:diaminopimelate epimerase